MAMNPSIPYNSTRAPSGKRKPREFQKTCRAIGKAVADIALLRESRLAGADRRWRNLAGHIDPARQPVCRGSLKRGADGVRSDRGRYELHERTFGGYRGQGEVETYQGSERCFKMHVPGGEGTGREGSRGSVQAVRIRHDRVSVLYLL